MEVGSTSTSTRLTATGIRFSYDRAFDQLRVEEFVAEPGINFIIGPNGSGKSTLLKLLAGLVLPRVGSVSFAGLKLNHRSTKREYFRVSGYLAQDYVAMGSMSVANYLAYRAWLHGMARTDIDQAVERTISSVGLEEASDESVRKLSGGMNRRVGLAAELIHEPKVLILDEPEAGLDIGGQRLAWNAISEYVERDFTVVVSTHDVTRIASTDSHVHVIHDGLHTKSMANPGGCISRSAIIAQMEP